MRLNLPTSGFIFVSFISASTCTRERPFHQGSFGCVPSGSRDPTGCHNFRGPAGGMEETETLIARTQLGSFVAMLKSYVGRDCFNYVDFSNQAFKMNQDFIAIKGLIENIHEYDDLANELEFPSHMFQVMAHSAMFLNDTSNDKRRGHLSVYPLIDLSVRILALHNVRGMLDTTNSKSEERIIGLYRELRDLVSNFVNEEGSQSIMSWMFRDLAIQAEQDLQKLWQQVSIDGIECLSKTDPRKCIQLP